MASTGVNVLRWSALGLGVLYGFTKQSSIRAGDRAAAAKAEWDGKERLIARAKEEWARKNAPAPSAAAASSSGGSNKKDLDGSEKDFDIETFLHLRE